MPTIDCCSNKPRRQPNNESNTINRTAFTWPLFLNDNDLTGGLKLFNGLGRINSFSLLRERPVQRHNVPGLGRRINSGVTVEGWLSA